MIGWKTKLWELSGENIQIPMLLLLLLLSSSSSSSSPNFSFSSSLLLFQTIVTVRKGSAVVLFLNNVLQSFCNLVPRALFPFNIEKDLGTKLPFLNYYCYYYNRIYNKLVLRALIFLQFSKLRKSATDVFAQKKFSKEVFNFEICYRYN